MEGFVDFLQAFLDLGATVILPVAIFLLGLFFGQKPGKAFRSGLTIGVAFVGIFLVIDLLVDNLGPAAQGMVEQLGVSLTVIRSEEHTSELQSRGHLVCRLLL